MNRKTTHVGGKLSKSLVILVALTCANARANDQIPQLTSYFDRQLSQIDSSLSRVTADQDANQLWTLQRFTLNFVPTVSFGVYGLFNVNVGPEFDFVFEKTKLP